ncbi:hypothetical protein CXB51_005479 [Gossypium anomalum]|uniref:Uncharacterized protein n=1 Tax=Gossypium anomalum TaxID=47600 RepID=A0A8J5ZWG9_9ROSI|nr:hypothetical protein CXB51_005479 [Gossypium anomalum]
MKVKSEPEDFDCNSDDFGLDNVVLKWISDRCETKKRKRFNFVGLNKETLETCSSVKLESPNFQHNGDIHDELEDPLIGWKSELFKNIKSSDEDLLELNRDWPAPIDVKVEVPESETANVNILKTDVPCPTTEPQYCSLNEVSYEYTKDSETRLDVGLSGCEIKEPQYCSLNEVSYEYMEDSETRLDVGLSGCETKEPQYCSLNEVSYEYRENFETKFDVGVSSWEIVQVHSPGSNAYFGLSGYRKEDYTIHPLSYDVSSEPMSPIKDYSYDVCDSCQNESPKPEMPWQTSRSSLIQILETNIASDTETGVSLYPIKCSVSNGVSYESTEDVAPKSGTSFSSCETVKVDSPEMISYLCSDLQEFGKYSYTVDPLTYAVPSKLVSPTKDHCIDLHDSFNSSEHKMSSQTGNRGRAEMPEMDIDNCFQCLETNNEDSACSFEGRSTHYWSSNIRNIVVSPSTDNGLYWSSSCLKHEKHSGLVSADSSSSKKQPLSPALIARNYFDASGKPLASPAPQDYHQMKHRHSAERLLSGRKAISPTSRERLCRAMRLTGLDENECHRKLKQLLHLDDGVAIKPTSTMRKAKQDKKESPMKGSLKCTYPPQCRSQSVIAFTQRQMQDFQSLAMKLTTELKSMKKLVKGKFQSESEASVATSANENADEVRVAIENATRAEEYARRWLSILTRDCNRFCKIMEMERKQEESMLTSLLITLMVSLQSLTEDNPAASERVIKKERKVSFADEAGGMPMIFMSTNFAHNNITTSNNITNNMIPNINVFCSLMKHLIFYKEDSTLTVTKYCTDLKVFIEFTKESLQPNNFFTSISNRHVLSFSGRQNDCSLQSGFLTDCTTSDCKDITCERSSSIKCSLPGFTIYLLTALTAYDKSGRKQTIAYMRDITALKYRTCDMYSISSSDFRDKTNESLKWAAKGVRIGLALCILNLQRTFSMYLF